MNLTLHPDAARNFNLKAEELFLELERRPAEPRRGANEPLDPDIHVEAYVKPEDIIGEIRFGHVDAFGNENAKSFKDGNEVVGLFGESYKKLVRLAEGMHRTKELKGTVSVTLLTDFIFDWLTNKCHRVQTSQMCADVLDNSGTKIEEIELWLPIHMLNVQSDINVGRIVFKTITRVMIDAWHANYLTHAKDAETIAAVEEFISRKRRELQGFAAATIRLTAEPRRAREIAFDEAEMPISLLRFYSPANFAPRLTSYCALLGRQHIDTYESLTIKNGLIICDESGLMDRAEPSWALSTSQIRAVRSAGLDSLSTLTLMQDRTEFQEQLISALTVYSRASLAKDFADKLIYALVAVESMFLLDSNEPIMDKLSERMAFLAGDTVKTRQGIVANIKKTYELRSQFIHHGRNIGIDDMEIVEEFMLTAWRCLQGLIQYATNSDSSKTGLFSMLENKKWS